VATRSVPACLPCHLEQRAIAAFLDRETARIDALVAKKERLVELLQEQRTALITRAVTKGLDPNVPMKDSGVEWLGEIPAHWDVRKLKHICKRVFVGIAEAATFAYVDAGVAMLRSTDVRANRIRTEDIRYIDQRFADALSAKRLRSGDIVTVRTGNAGVSAVVPVEYDGGQCFTLVVSRLARGYDSRCFCYWLNADPGQRQFAVEGMGTAQINISVPIVQNTIVCVPPATEQGQVAEFLDWQTGRWDSLIVTIQQATERLKELRTALISAAVTGKIDVRGEVA
jgi:type I restriction enzyme S subunit